ncbi:thioredoxin domain-containing protein [Arcobacter sp. CECT 8985]|uniref:DsbA family protein n=1 Tax=Arcobacter sp. CECT 8985 TaxID=1935424 RepID=UPI00100A279D|nr:thioredoxin domain-containing protein [Arcobacter sp. CECT 8985]RXJ88213.1 disulfide bond formation protein DsbA [Arcobacter sp. CECT 8985]
MKNKKIVLGSILTLLIAFIAVTYYYQNKKSEEYSALLAKKQQYLQRDYSIVEGNKDAKVQLVEFFDPACGTCAQFYPHVKQIMKKNEGDIKLVLRYTPFHQNSDFAVRVLESARKQGKFFDVLEFMFSTQRYWIDHHVVNPKKLISILPKSGVDMSKLAEHINDEEITKRIKQDLADAKQLNVTKTPEYFVNGKPLEKFGLQELKDLINSEL